MGHSEVVVSPTCSSNATFIYRPQSTATIYSNTKQDWSRDSAYKILHDAKLFGIASSKCWNHAIKWKRMYYQQLSGTEHTFHTHGPSFNHWCIQLKGSQMDGIAQHFSMARWCQSAQNFQQPLALLFLSNLTLLVKSCKHQRTHSTV